MVKIDNFVKSLEESWVYVSIQGLELNLLFNNHPSQFDRQCGDFPHEGEIQLLRKVGGSHCRNLIHINFKPIALEVQIVGVLQSLCHFEDAPFAEAGIEHLRYLGLPIEERL